MSLSTLPNRAQSAEKTAPVCSAFCPVPWKYVFIATNGSLLSCVIAASTEGRGLVTGPGGNPMKAGEVSLEEFRNSEPLKELRKNMLEGRETPSVCRRCMDEEALGLISRRILENRKGYIEKEEALSLTQEDGSIPVTSVPVANFNMRLGNHCNLACSTCGPSQSSGWYDEWLSTRFKGFRDGGARYELSVNSAGKAFLPGSPYYWYKNETFWDDLLQRAPGIRELHFSGGEPFLSAQHFILLERLAERGFADKIVLDYNSNLTVLPGRLLAIWPRFREVRIGVSIDGIGEVNDYVRYPSTFAGIEKNLARLDSAPENVRYWVTTTISALNVGRLPELFSWILNSPLKKMNRNPPYDGSRFFSYHMLRKPAEMNAKVLSARAKRIVSARFREYSAALEAGKTGADPAEAEALRLALKGIEDFMAAEDHSRFLPQLKEELGKSDSFRGTRAQRLDTELWEAL